MNQRRSLTVNPKEIAEFARLTAASPIWVPGLQHRARSSR